MGRWRSPLNVNELQLPGQVYLFQHVPGVRNNVTRPVHRIARTGFRSFWQLKRRRPCPSRRRRSPFSLASLHAFPSRPRGLCGIGCGEERQANGQGPSSSIKFIAPPAPAPRILPVTHRFRYGTKIIMTEPGQNVETPAVLRSRVGHQNKAIVPRDNDVQVRHLEELANRTASIDLRTSHLLVEIGGVLQHQVLTMRMRE